MAKVAMPNAMLTAPPAWGHCELDARNASRHLHVERLGRIGFTQPHTAYPNAASDLEAPVIPPAGASSW